MVVLYYKIGYTLDQEAQEKNPAGFFSAFPHIKECRRYEQRNGFLSTCYR